MKKVFDGGRFIMNLKRLGYFVTIVEEKQITKAANKLHMAQPPLSQQLKLLEEDLGVLLFDRIGRRLELTESGRVLYEKSKILLSQYEESFTEVREVAKGMSGVLSIGSVKSCFSYIPERLKFFREQYPEIRFTLKEGDTSRMTAYLKKREIEVAIVRLPLELEEFSSILLPPDSFVLVASKKWRHNETITMKELEGLPLMMLHRVSGVGLYELVISECRNHGFEPTIICECPDADMLLSLVHKEVGYAILPKSTVYNRFVKDLQVIEIVDCGVKSEAAVIWLKNRYLSQSTTRFLETFQKPFIEGTDTFK